MQTDLKCCGLKGPKDYFYLNFYPNETSILGFKDGIDYNLPSSCCGDEKEWMVEPNKTCTISKIVFKEGCAKMPKSVVSVLNIIFVMYLILFINDILDYLMFVLYVLLP